MRLLFHRIIILVQGFSVKVPINQPTKKTNTQTNKQTNKQTYKRTNKQKPQRRNLIQKNATPDRPPPAAAMLIMLSLYLYEIEGSQT